MEDVEILDVFFAKVATELEFALQNEKLRMPGGRGVQGD